MVGAHVYSEMPCFRSGVLAALAAVQYNSETFEMVMFVVRGLFYHQEKSVVRQLRCEAVWLSGDNSAVENETGVVQ